MVQILAILSIDADGSSSESCENTTDLTQLLWPSSVWRHLPLPASRSSLCYHLMPTRARSSRVRRLPNRRCCYGPRASGGTYSTRLAQPALSSSTLVFPLGKASLSGCRLDQKPVQMHKPEEGSFLLPIYDTMNRRASRTRSINAESALP